jgi:endo-1,4-beta-xylanase
MTEGDALAAGYREGPRSSCLPALRHLADEAGIRVGAALMPEVLGREPRYAKTAEREFNSVTAENALKWALVHPAPDVWCYRPADAVVDFAEGRGVRIRGHVLLWHEQLPSWVGHRMTASELGAALARHIGPLVRRYRGRVAVWDVVNEAVAPTGRGLRRTVFRQTLGEDYIAEAFWLAHAADPDAVLFYNEYGAEALDRKSDFVYRLLCDLREKRVPVHGVGLQMHVDAARLPDLDAVHDNVARLAALGLAVEITEMDVRLQSLAGDRARRLAIQRGVYRDIVSACLTGSRCRAVTFWGITDRYSWIDARWGADHPLLFDEDYRPKPAYLGVLDAIRAHGAEDRGPW